MKFDAKQVIPAFDDYLHAEGLKFSAVAIGGSALAILGMIDRHTQDLDLLTSPIPTSIQNAAVHFAQNHLIDSNWLNNAPLDLANHLPKDWMSLTEDLYCGKALTLKSLCRLHMIYAKFWAMCDRDRDLSDLVAMNPDPDEIEKAVAWTKPLDGNAHWVLHVESMAERLAKEIIKVRKL